MKKGEGGKHAPGTEGRAVWLEWNESGSMFRDGIGNCNPVMRRLLNPWVFAQHALGSYWKAILLGDITSPHIGFNLATMLRESSRGQRQNQGDQLSGSYNNPRERYWRLGP